MIFSRLELESDSAHINYHIEKTPKNKIFQLFIGIEIVFIFLVHKLLIVNSLEFRENRRF